MPRPLPRTTRRTALGGSLAAVLGASGCSLLSGSDDARPSAGATAPSPGAPGATETVPGPDVDADLVTDVLRQLSITHRVVHENRRAHASLRPALAPLERLHAAHADELGDLVPVVGRVADRAEAPAVALARVATAEDRLERRLVRAAIAAESGALAQLLASMAAAVAQERTLL